MSELIQELFIEVVLEIVKVNFFNKRRKLLYVLILKQKEPIARQLVLIWDFFQIVRMLYTGSLGYLGWFERVLPVLPTAVRVLPGISAKLRRR